MQDYLEEILDEQDTHSDIWSQDEDLDEFGDVV